MTIDATTPTTTRFDSADGTSVALHRWDPTGPPRGVVVLAHGMGEHLRRYGHLAGALTGAGFVAVGPDHRGHGETAESDAALGSIGGAGWTALLDDLGAVVEQAHAEFPDLPVVLFAHSMGSFAAQQYLLDHSDRISGLALSGTAAIDPLEAALDLDGPVDLSAFNAPFAPARTDFDWLSRDEAQVDAYVADPHCGFGLDGEAAKAMFAGAREVADPARLSAVRSDLPVHVTVGALDPVGGGGALVDLLVGRLEAAGLTDVTRTTWPDARHEIFNETNRDEVEADLLAWLDRVAPPR